MNRRGRVLDVDVSNQEHYTQFPLQPKEFFRANRKVLDGFQMAVIKYACRYKKKGGLRDIDKAIDYLQMMREDWLLDHPDEAE